MKLTEQIENTDNNMEKIKQHIYEIDTLFSLIKHKKDTLNIEYKKILFL